MKLTKSQSILLPDIYLPPVLKEVSLHYRKTLKNPIVIQTFLATKNAVDTAVRVRLSHSIVMLIIYGNVNSLQKLKTAAKGIAKAVMQHAFHNGMVAATYTAIVMALGSIRKRNDGRIAGIRSNSVVESLLAGSIAGAAAFSLDQSAVALQVFAFVLGRSVQSLLPGVTAPVVKPDTAVLTSSVTTPVAVTPPKKMLYRAPTSQAITIAGAIAYAFTLTMHSHGHDRLNSGLSRSLSPIYGKFGAALAAVA